MPQAIKRALVYFNLLIFLFQSTASLAGGIVAANSGATAPQVIDNSSQAPVLIINAPSPAGLSHNQFEQFNVDSRGLIVNNAADSVQTQLNGQIEGNSRLAAGSEARVILNEVTSSNPSALNGVTEIAGKQAEYIVANPYGISCDGCGFINTPDVTLTTGRPTVANGELQKLTVQRGVVAFNGQGAQAGNVNNFNVISRAVELNGNIQAARINMLMGQNDYNVKTGELTALPSNGSEKPAFALDSSHLGGMYAGAITLVGTEQGVGVNMSNIDATATHGNLILTADGKIAVGKIAANDTLSIHSANGGVDLVGTAYAGKSAVVRAAQQVSIAETAALASAEHISVDADSVIHAGDIIAGVAGDGSLSADTVAVLNAQQSITNTGTIQAGTVIAEAGQRFDNQNGTLVADYLIVKTEELQNSNGSIESGKELLLTANLINNNSGTIVASDSANVIASADIDNSDGLLLLEGAETNLSAGGSIINNFGSILHTNTGTAAVTALVAIDNTDGSIGSAGVLAIASGGALINEFGDIAATALGGSVHTIDNTDGVIEVGALALDVSADLNNSNGLLSALVDVDDALFLTIGGLLNNAGGHVISNARSSSIFAAEINNSAGLLSNAGDGYFLVASTGTANNSAGDIISNGQLDLWVGALMNSGGAVQAGGFLNVQAEADVDNRLGFVESGDGLILEAASLLNRDGIISNLGFSSALVGVDETIDNSAGLIQSSGEHLDLNATTLINNGGEVAHSGEGWFSIFASLANRAGEILSNGSLDIWGDTLDNQQGNIASEGDTYLWADGDINNAEGRIDARGSVDIYTDKAIYNVAGAITAASQDASYIVAMLDINNTDGLLYANAESLEVISESANLINNGGDILHAGSGELSLRGINLGNVRGQISSNGLANVQAFDDLDNSAGHISANNIYLAARQITNNDDAFAYAGNTLTVDAASLLNKTGTLGADMMADFTLNALDNSGGVMRSDDTLKLNLAWSDARQYGGIISANHTFIDVAGDYHNGLGNTVQGNGSLTFNVTGDITNEGAISALGSLTLNGENLVNQVDGVLSAELNTTLNLINLLNLGRISAGQDVELNAVDIDNYGVIAGRRDVLANVEQTFSNSDFVFAGRNIGLKLGNQFNNLDEATLFAMGSVGVGGLQADSNALRVLNESSSIEAYNGDIAILADELINKRTVFTAEAGGNPTTDQRIEMDCSSGACNFIVQEMVGPTILEQSAKGEILAGGDIRLVLGDLTNSHSLIAAGGNLDIAGNSLDNQALDLGTVWRTAEYSGAGFSAADVQQAATDVNTWNSQFNANLVLTLGDWRYEFAATEFMLSVIPYWEMYGWAVEITGGTDRTVAAATPDSVLSLLLAGTTEHSKQSISSSVIQAGGNFTGSFTNALDNLSVKEGEGPLLLDIKTANTDSTGLQLADVGITSVEQLDASNELEQRLAQLRALAAGEAGNIDVAAQRDALNLASHNPVARGISVPSGNGLFELATSLSTGVLIQTNADYFDTSAQLGTDYLLSRVEHNFEATNRRLGDAFYESRLLRDAIFYGSGRRYLEGFSSDEGQFKHLMDNAIAQENTLALRVGQALKAEQVEGLETSIVWLVEQEVEGLRALVPVYYAAGDDKKQSSANVIASRLALESGGDINNDQLLSGGDLLALVSGNTINNSVGGALESNASVLLTATNDINNLGGNISAGQDIEVMSVAGDFNHGAEAETTVTNVGGSYGLLTWNTETAVNVAGEAGVLSAANNVSVNVGGDTSISGGEIDAGGDLVIDAVGDIAINTAVNSTVVESSFCYLGDCTVTASSSQVDSQVGSNVETGGAIHLNAGGSIDVVGSELTADGDIALAATDINIAGADSGDAYMGSVLSASGDLIVNAESSAALTGSALVAAGDLAIATQLGDLTINGAITTAKSSVGGSYWRTSSVDSHYASSLTAEGNISILSGNDANLNATDVSAGGDISIQADSDIVFGSETITEQNDWRKYLGSRRSATEGNELTQSIITSLTSGGNVSVIAVGNVEGDGTAIAAAGDVGINTAGTLDLRAVANTASWYSHYRGRKTRLNQGASELTHTLADIRAGGDVSLTAGVDAFIEGVRLNSLGDASISAGGDVALFAVNDERSSYYEKRKKRKFGRKSRRTADTNANTVQGTSLETDGDISIQSGVGTNSADIGDISIVGSSLSADGDIDLVAARDLIIRAAQEKYWKRTEHEQSGGFDYASTVVMAAALSTAGAAAPLAFGAGIAAGTQGEDGFKATETSRVTNISSVLTAGSNVSLDARRDIVLQAAKVSAGDELSVTAAAGQVLFLIATDIDSVSTEGSSESFMFQSQSGEGHYDETVVMNHLTGNSISLHALNGIHIEHLGEEGVDYSSQEVLGAAIDQLAAENEAYEWLLTLKQRDDVVWQSVVEAHESWDYESQGLTEVGAAIVAIASAAFVGPYAQALGQAAGGALAGAGASAATGAAVQTAVAGASKAWMAQALTSAVANQGDVGAVFDEVFDSKYLESIGKDFAQTLLIGGQASIGGAMGFPDLEFLGSDGSWAQMLVQSGEYAFQRAATDALIHGKSFGESFENNLKFAVIDSVGDYVAGEIGATFKDDGPSGPESLNYWNHKLQHALLGCAMAAANRGDCKSGAAGAVIGEIIAEQHRERIYAEIDTNLPLADQERLAGEITDEAVALARIGGVLAANAVNGDVRDGDMAAADTAENNAIRLVVAGIKIAGKLTIKMKQKGGKLSGKDVRDTILNEGRHILLNAAELLDGDFTVDDIGAVLELVTGIDPKWVSKKLRAGAKHSTNPTIPKIELVEELKLTDTQQRWNLRKRMGAKPGEIAHHVVPLEALKKFPELMQKAAAGGFDLNGKANGAILKSRVDHRGGHPEYNRVMLTELRKIDINQTPKAIANQVQNISDIMKNAIRKGTYGPWG